MVTNPPSFKVARVAPYSRCQDVLSVDTSRVRREAVARQRVGTLAPFGAKVGR